jgi:nitroreductase
MPAEAIASWQGPGDEADPRRWALGYAILAPNPHNRQPWLVDLREPNVITLYCDKERVLPETDPFGRQILIGHGCFLELLAIALAERGFAADITLFPQGEVGASLADLSTKPIARISLKPGAAKDALFTHILKRHTPKEAFDLTQPVAAEAMAALRASIAGQPVVFGGTTQTEQVAMLRKLAMDAARMELETERTMMESVRLIRVGPSEINQHRDGISMNSWFIRFAATVGLFNRNEFPKPGSTGHKQAIARYETFTATAPGFVWMSTTGNSRTQQVQSGRAYVRMQLAAVPLGLGVHPLSQALQEFTEMKPHYERIHQVLLNKTPQQETLQMFCRIGYPKTPAGPTPRRGVKAIIQA